MKFKIKRRTRLFGHLLASAMIIALAVYGWDLPIMTAAKFLMYCVSFLVVIVAIAAIFGWLMAKLQSARMQQLPMEDNGNRTTQVHKVKEEKDDIEE